MEILGAGLFVSSLLGWSLAAQKIFRKNHQASFFIGLQILILGLYVVALLQVLIYGAYLIEAIGVATLIYSFRTQSAATYALASLKKFYYIIPYLILTFTIPEDFRFTMSDEFPSWAANIKTMYDENSLGGIDSATRSIASGFYQSYPPFQQLFQYLFLRNTYWSESNVQIAQNILVLSVLLGSVAFTLESRPLIIFPAWIGAICLYFLFGFTMSNLLADGLLAAQFAVCLGLATTNKGGNRDYLLLGLLIGNLILIKPTGFVLAVCATLLGIAVLVSSYIKPRGKLLGAEVVLNPKIYWRKLLLMVSLPVATYVSWQVHLRIIQMTPGAENFSFSHVGTTKTLIRWNKTWAAYKENFFGSLYGEDNLAGISSTAPNVVRVFNVSLFMIFIALAIFQTMLAATDKARNRRTSLHFAFLIITLAIFYQVFLLFLYMFFFGEYEGTRSAALVRYSASFFLGWTILVFAQLVKKASYFKYSSTLIFSVVSTLVLIAPPSLTSSVRGNYTDFSKLPARIDVEKMVPDTIRLIHENKKIYYVYQGSNGFEKYIYSYLVLPRKTNWTCPSLGKPLYFGDVWTCDLTLDRVIRGYDYLVVGKADAQFWASNSKFLTQGSQPVVRGVFRILDSGDGVQLALMN